MNAKELPINSFYRHFNKLVITVNLKQPWRQSGLEFKNASLLTCGFHTTGIFMLNTQLMTGFKMRSSWPEL